LLFQSLAVQPVQEPGCTVNLILPSWQPATVSEFTKVGVVVNPQVLVPIKN